MTKAFGLGDGVTLIDLVQEATGTFIGVVEGQNREEGIVVVFANEKELAHAHDVGCDSLVAVHDALGFIRGAGCEKEDGQRLWIQVNLAVGLVSLLFCLTSLKKEMVP